jgi:hypothetical protein
VHIPPWAPVLTDSAAVPAVVLRGHRHEDTDTVLAQCQDPAFERWTTVP